MDSSNTILGGIEPEVAERLITRREAIRKGATVSSTLAAGLALGSVPVAIAALTRDAYAQSPSTVTSTLNFALMLEIFENEFYKAVLGTSSSATQNSAFSTVRTAAAAVPGAVTALGQIQKHEAAHVAFLLANGASNVLSLTADSFDFTGGGAFAAATTSLPFLLLTAQAAEDTGVRAYKGQAPNLMGSANSTVLEAALRIHSVEARHASKIRRMRRQTGAPTAVKYSGTVSGDGGAAAGSSNISSPPAGAVSALAAIYAGEGNTTQGTFNAATVTGLPGDVNLSAAASEAFDEPLTRVQVTAIVQVFFKVAIPTS